MEFRPFGKKYIFSKEVLVRHFPEYMKPPINTWLREVLDYSGMLVSNNYVRPTYYITQDFQHALNLKLRELFPQDLNEFIQFTFADADRLCNILAMLLQSRVNTSQAKMLERILSEGSAYKVIPIDITMDSYSTGGYDLSKRVPEVVKVQAEEALAANDLLQDAWNICYSRTPNYEKVVSQSCDFLEGYLGRMYFPTDTKPQLKKFVHSFEDKPGQLNYKGDTIVAPRSTITSLLREASNIRGQHIAGRGRVPTKDEAEFVLHTTIYIWNLHRAR